MENCRYGPRIGILCERINRIAQERMNYGLRKEQVTQLELMKDEYKAMVDNGINGCGYVYRKLLFNLEETYKKVGETEKAEATKNELQREMPTLMGIIDSMLGIVPKESFN